MAQVMCMCWSGKGASESRTRARAVTALPPVEGETWAYDSGLESSESGVDGR
jgi:hypothetical protein